MKLQYVSICGFRGFREPTRIDFETGFTVIVGPNGSGKSTVCDAIEFALLGRIRPSSDHKEKGESIHDYLWWRGAGTPKESFVELGLVTESGETHRVRRTPSAGSSVLPPEILQALISDGASIDDPIGQLCRTAVLRDEDITRLSVDLPEADRFGFVRAALGSADFTEAEAKANRVSDYVGQQLSHAQRAYDSQRNEVADLTAKLSALRAESGRSPELELAERSLRALLTSKPPNLSDLAREAESGLAQARTRADVLTRIYTGLSRLQERLKAQAAEDSERQLASLSKQVEQREQELAQAQADLVRASASLREAELAAPRVTSLAQLQEHGARLGLIQGRCPLCAAEQSEEHFAEHLRSLRTVIQSENALLAARSSEEATARVRVDTLLRDVARVRAEAVTLSAARSALVAEIAEVSAQLAPLGVTAGSDVAQTIQAAAKAIELARARSVEIETGLAVVRSSQAAAQLAQRELELDAARTRLITAERAISRLASAEANLKEAVRTVRRVQGELIDEQLAALSPLLAELFQRLRPHVDWQTIRYNLRGDVRRMLSLEVGEGLNPSFVFSSGQRRAAGLAFLLAIHLSRGWCGLRTLILDDPVQHVDDYRALHLTEVLTAIRRGHRQLVCTVEDTALAELLARRLRSRGDEPGAVVRLCYESGVGSRIAERRVVPPHERRVLVAGAS